MLFKNIIGQTYVQLFRHVGSKPQAIREPTQLPDHVRRLIFGPNGDSLLLLGAKISCALILTTNQLNQVVLPISDPVQAEAGLIVDTLGHLTQLQLNASCTDVQAEIIGAVGQMSQICGIGGGFYYLGGLTTSSAIVRVF